MREGNEIKMIYDGREKSLTIKCGGKVVVPRNNEWPEDPYFVMVLKVSDHSVTLLD